MKVPKGVAGRATKIWLGVGELRIYASVVLVQDPFMELTQRREPIMANIRTIRMVLEVWIEPEAP